MALKIEVKKPKLPMKKATKSLKMKAAKSTPPKTLSPRKAKKHAKKVIKARRPSFDIARDFVELNFAVLMEPELTPKEAKKARKAEAKLERLEARRRHRVRNTLLSLLGLLIICAGIAMFWWTTALKPVNPNDTKIRQFVVDQGTTTDQVATALQKAGFIRSELAFRIYSRLNKTVVQAGTHFLSASYSTPEIVKKLTQATADEVEIQVPPGLSLKQLRTTWKKYGYSDSEIDAAYSAEYESSLFEGRPSSLSIEMRLEGYIYPETYRIYRGDRLEILIKKCLDQFEQVVAKNDLVAQFAARGLSFYEGLTLTSIVQLEARKADEQQMVASVFYNRLGLGMSLGSDPTYRYAEANGLCGKGTAGTTCNSPYNTRIHVGLPPSPIANVNEQALIATTNPPASDNLYFVTGDDGITRFAKTLAEHEENKKYCIKLCRSY